MEAKRPNVDELVQSTLDYVKKHAPQDYSKLESEPEKKKELTQAVRSAIEEEINLASIGESLLTGKQAKSTYEEQLKYITAEFGKHLSKEQIEKIKKGLQIPTYILDTRKEGGKNFVDVTRNGKKFMESRELATVEDIDWATAIQYASILVEAVLLVLQAVGVSVEVSDSVIEEVAEETVTAIESSSVLQKAIQALEAVWDNPSSSALDKAKAIFYLIKDSYSAGILWTIIKGICKNMSAWEWIKTAAVVTAMIIAALATDGAALIAKIALTLYSAYTFAKKLTNLKQFKEIKATLK